MRRIRPFSWFIIIVNIFFLYAIFSGLNETSKSCDGLSGDDLNICQAGTAIGAGIGVFALVFFWVLVDLILLILWIVSNKKARTCPACGRKVKVGKTECDKCGHKFGVQ